MKWFQDISGNRVGNREACGRLRRACVWASKTCVRACGRLRRGMCVWASKTRGVRVGV